MFSERQGYWRRGKSRSGVVLRSAAALSLAGVMTLSALAGNIAPTQAQAASTGTAAAEISPADSVLYFGITLDTSSAQWAQALELLQRVGVDEDPAEVIDDVTSSATGQDNEDVSGSEALLGGEAALVITNLEGLSGEAGQLSGVMRNVELPIATEDSQPGEPIGLAIVIQPSDIDAATKQFQDEMDSGATPPVETEYNGTTIYSTPADESTGESGTAYAIVGDFIVVSETPTDIEPFIDTAAGDEDALSDLDAFDRADEALAGERLGFGFVNGTVVADDVAALDTSGLGLGDTLGDVFGTTYYSGLSLIAADEGFRFDAVQIPADGAAARPSGTAADLTFAEKVPSNTLVFANSFNFGQGALLQGLGLALVTAVSSQTSFGAATPTPVPTADELYQQVAQLIGFNLKSDFLDQMTGEYGIALWASEDGSDFGAILTSDVDSAPVLTDSLSKISLLVQAASQGQVTIATRTIGEGSVSKVTISQEGGRPIVIEYGVVDDQFLLGYGNSVDEYLGGPSDSLADSDNFTSALAALPAEYDGVYFLNVAEAAAMGQDTGLTDGVDFLGATPVAGGASPVRSFAAVTYVQDELRHTSSILLIAEP